MKKTTCLLLFLLFLSLFKVDAQSFTQFRGLGSDDSAGPGFKTISTNSVLVVSNNATGTTGATVGSELFSKLTTAGGTDVITLKADGINAVSFDVNDLSIFNYLVPASDADYTTNTKIVFKNAVGTAIRTMTLNGAKSLTSSMSGVSIGTFFDNNASLPVTGVSEIEITINPSTVSVDAFTIKNITLSNIVSGTVPSGPGTLDFNTLGISNTIINTLGKSTAIGPLNFEINSPNANDLITYKAEEGAGGTGALYDNNFDIGGITKWTISRHDGSEFTLSSIYLQEAGVGASTSGTLKARRNGTQVGSTVNVTFNGNIDVSGNPDFTNIDEVWIEAADINFYLDNVVYIIPSTIVMPIVSTAAATSITATGVTFNGEVTNDGGATVTERGFVYSITDNTPTIGETNVTNLPDGDGTGVFSEAISGLSASTTYYYQAYATNSEGTAYGGVQSFTTSAPNTAPIVDANTGLTVIEGGIGIIDSGKLHFNDDETEDDSQLTATITTAVDNGILFIDNNFNYVFDSGDEELILSATFTQDDINNDLLIYISTTDNDTEDSFEFTLSDPDGGELPNQTFTITISPVEVPTITTTIASDVTTTSATLGGNVTNNGGASVTERGIVYNTTGTPTVNDDTKVQIGSGDGSFSDEITGLIAGTTYYVRAYATNTAGTSYGGEESFITSTLGLEEELLNNSISLYPNPINDVVYVTNQIKVEKVSLFDVLGKRIDNIKIENDAINLSNIKTGIYLLKIETYRGSLVKRIVKK